MFGAHFPGGMVVDVVIVGAGPAGLAVAKKLRELGVSSHIFEAGPMTTERMKQGVEAVVNGVGGAAFWSDRKLTAWPAGVNALRHGNPHEMVDSMMSTLDHIATVLPQHKPALEELKTRMVELLSLGPDASAEAIWRSSADLDRFRQVKLPPGVVLEDFWEVVKLITSYLHPDLKNIEFNKPVKRIDISSDKFIFVKTNTGTKTCRRVVVATGRLGPLQRLLPSTVPVRTEIGVRIGLDTLPELRTALLELKVADPKIKIVRRLMIGGEPVECEFRTFCVCIPGSVADDLGDPDRPRGYVVQSEDRLTGIQGFHGSSSAEELRLRRDHANVYPGDNLGIMMRMKRKPWDQAGCTGQGGKLMACQVTSSDMLAVRLSEVYAEKYCGALARGITELIHTICGAAPKDLVVSAPCIEGVGMYPEVDKGTRQLVSDPRVYVCGDGGYGGTRGFLQALVDGDYTAKVVQIDLGEKKHRGLKLLADYQSLVNPIFAYGKVVLTGPPTVPPFSFENDMVKVLARAAEIEAGMKSAACTSEAKGLGVIYELHHFLLGDVQAAGTLDRVDTASLEVFLKWCNAVDEHRDLMRQEVVKMLDVVPPELWEKHRETLRFQLTLAFTSHRYKSCMLSLRNKATGVDIPVLQSAYKLCPVTSVTKNALGLDFADPAVVAFQTRVVALTAAFLDHLTSANKLFTLVRTKIETQQVSVEVVGENSSVPYCECHVKVNMTSRDGGDPVDYETKKRIMHELSGLFDGPNAVFPHFSKTLAVSINLQKHPDLYQQFFLTFRTDTIEEMDYLRRRFARVANEAVLLAPPGLILADYELKYVPDAEIIVYDDKPELDADVGWYPAGNIPGFLPEDWKSHVDAFLDRKSKVFFATKNAHKVAEVQPLLEDRYVLRVDPPIVSATSFALVSDAVVKAKVVFTRWQRPVVTESSGLEILGNFPGAHTDQLIEQAGGLEQFVRFFGEGTKVTVRSVGVYRDGVNKVVKQATIEGELCMPSGEHGFGWDSIVKVEGGTLASSSPGWKAAYTPRRKVFRALFQWFR